MPLNVKCKRCANLKHGWCALKIDSPDPNMVRDCVWFRTRTNHDNLLDMSREELAEWLEEHCYQYGWLDWLKQEVDDAGKT